MFQFCVCTWSDPRSEVIGVPCIYSCATKSRIWLKSILVFVQLWMDKDSWGSMLPLHVLSWSLSFELSVVAEVIVQNTASKSILQERKKRKKKKERRKREKQMDSICKPRVSDGSESRHVVAYPEVVEFPYTSWSSMLNLSLFSTAGTFHPSKRAIGFLYLVFWSS